MQNKSVYLLFLIFLLTPAIFIFLFFAKRSFVHAATTHIVISQIQIAAAGAGNADDEFIELYNPTNISVDIAGWRLSRETSNSSAKTNLVASLSGNIKPYGYFLIGSPMYTTHSVIAADIIYTSTTSAISNNNTILLFSDAGNTVIDKVGMGTAQDSETATAANPTAGESILRKANADATAASMTGGADEFAGNGFDDDNNANDFVLVIAPMPRNSDSQQEPPMTTDTPTLSIIPTPTLTPSATPTLTPTDMPTPTTTPIPTGTPPSTPTEAPTPTMKPSSTPTLPLTPSPTITLSPTPFLQQSIFPNLRLVCALKTLTINAGFIHLSIPQLQCNLEKI